MEGKEIVLTSDRTLMSDYRHNFFYGFAVCAPRIFMPGFLCFRLFCPQVETDNGVVKYAQISLRKVESCLSNTDVEIIHPEYLKKHIGEKTKVVGVNCVDPKGTGPVPQLLKFLFKGFLKGRVNHTKYEFESMMKQISELKRDYDFKVVVGGWGAWELNKQDMERHNIDYIFRGEAEGGVSKLFSNICKRNFPKNNIITAKIPKPNEIVTIKKPTFIGTVEISRGCGKGCSFCSPTVSGCIRSVPIKNILKEVKVNSSNGHESITFQTDDFLAYCSKKRFVPNEDALINLFKSVLEVKGVKRVWPMHGSLAPIAYNPDIVVKLSNLLRKYGQKFCGFQPGIETGSVRLIKKHMTGKVLPFKDAEQWHSIVKDSFKVLDENNWFPCTTIMVGLPGEGIDDIKETIRLVDSISDYKSALFPLVFVPEEATSLRDIRKVLYSNKKPMYSKFAKKLIKKCLKHTFKYVNYAHQKTTNLSEQNLAKKFLIKSYVWFLSTIVEFIR